MIERLILVGMAFAFSALSLIVWAVAEDHVRTVERKLERALHVQDVDRQVVGMTILNQGRLVELYKIATGYKEREGAYARFLVTR